MPQRPFPPDHPRAWLRRARSNLIRARHQISGVYLEDLCFDAHPKGTSSLPLRAQQAAEKSVKAVLIHIGVDFPYTHDLADLLTLVEDEGVSVPAPVLDATILSDYAVETRYPGLTEPVTEDEYEEAVAIAERVVTWTEETLETRV